MEGLDHLHGQVELLLHPGLLGGQLGVGPGEPAVERPQLAISPCLHPGHGHQAHDRRQQGHGRGGHGRARRENGSRQAVTGSSAIHRSRSSARALGVG